MKRRFRILLIAPEYNLDIQARLPAALCTIHNFIRIHDPQEPADQHDTDAFVFNTGNPRFDNDYIASAEEAAAQDQPSARRDQIAQEMWDDYQRILQEREDMESASDEEDNEDEDEDELSDGDVMSD